MPRASERNRFGRKYDFFLSEASNEEIVSVSKELTDSLSEQAKTVIRGATALLSVTLLAVILAILTLSGMDTSVSGSVKATVFVCRMTAVLLLCISAFEDYFSLERASAVSAGAAILWRHVRETPSDDTAFEQTNAVKSMSQAVVSAKNLFVMSAFVMAVAGLLLGFSYVIEMMAEYGYI